MGSIAIQIAKTVAKLRVIATASRPETRQWCQDLGADDIVNHRQDLAEQVEQADYILCLNNTDMHWQAMTKIIKPQGMICSVVENQHSLNMALLKSKSAGFVWEFMFTRAMYQTEDMEMQRALLNAIATLVDNNTIKTTCNEIVNTINAENLRQVHAKIEAGRSIGKTVLAGWG